MAIDTYNHIIDEYIKYLKEVNMNGGIPFQRETDYLISVLPSKSKILDVGTAMGYYSKYLIENSNKDFEVTGIDASNKMIEEAKKMVLKVNFEVMDIRDMKYADKSFDCIMCFGTLIHLNDDDCLQALKTFDNPIYNEDSVGDDLAGTNEFSIIARKNILD